MNRRDLLQLGGLMSLGLLTPKTSRAQERYGGPVLLHFHANGGWDPTMFCDAKLESRDSSKPLNQDSFGAIVDLNSIKVPSMPRGMRYDVSGEYAWSGEGYINNRPIEAPERFFRSPAGQRFLVINGIDTRTNSHETGTQFVGCGHMTQEYPALAAMVAARVAQERDLPMAFLAGGAYNLTNDVIAASRFDRDRLANVAFPYRPNPNSMTSSFLSPKVQSRLQQAKQARLTSLAEGALLPRAKTQLAIMREAQEGGSGLSLLAEVFQSANLTFDAIGSILPYQVDTSLAWMREYDRWVNFTRPIESLLRCFSAGVAASATYSIPRGFDSHDSHDSNQSASLAWQLLALRYTIARADALGLTNRLYVLVTSDFGRTPMYNTNNKGKDHWNVTSMLVAGPGIRGGRAIGASDAGHKPMRVDTTNINQVREDDAANAIRIRPSHVHRELRRVFQVDEQDFARKFALPSGEGEEALALLA
jgi:hypothetical protein